VRQFDALAGERRRHDVAGLLLPVGLTAVGHHRAEQFPRCGEFLRVEELVELQCRPHRLGMDEHVGQELLHLRVGAARERRDGSVAAAKE